MEVESFFDGLSELEFCNNGPLHSPIKKQVIKFDKFGKLILTTIAEGNASARRVEHRAGTVRINSDKAILKSINGRKVELRGIQPFTHSINNNYKSDTSELVETSSVDELYCELLNRCESDIQIEYISNLEDIYHFPDSVDEKISHKNQISIDGGNDKKFVIEHTGSSGGLSRSALFLNIHGINLYVVSLKGNRINSGVIIYESTQDRDTRDKIRDCISFSLGKRINYHGYIILDKNYKYVEISYISNRFKNLDKEYPALMPAPLGRAHLQLGSNETNRLVSALFDNYDKYKLRHVLWGYWYALEAPLHMAGVHFGACIEAFQSAYISANSDSFPKKLIDTIQWKKFRNIALNSVDELDIPQQELQVLKNKINNLNQTPQSVITYRFFAKLGINLSNLENTAWKERNNAAHGKSSDENAFEDKIRNIKILKCLLHRMLLIATNASDFYFDYYSYDFPARALNESIVQPIA